jgi:phage tail sheath protein FI
MAEYLYPGVYVTEIAADAKPIEGVSTSTADLIGSDIVAKFQRLSQHPPPDWTQHNEHDPGISLLELCAWLTETLLYRAEQLPERGVLHAARLAAAALALVADREQPCGSVLKKVHFFEGRLLNDDDLRTELEYTRPPVKRPG